MRYSTARIHLLRTVGVAVAFVALAAVPMSAAAAGHVRLAASRGPDASDVPAPTTVLVQYRQGTSLLARSRSRARAGVAHDRAAPGPAREVVRPSGDQSVEQAVATLQADPDVELAAPNIHFALAADPADEPFRAPLEWGLENGGGDCIGASTDALGVTCAADVDIDALAGWRAATGQGITIAVLDDGLDFSQPELDAQAWTNPGETGTDGNGKDKATNNVDDDGNGFTDDVHGVNLCAADANSRTLHRAGADWHGTAVASVAAAEADGNGMTGVAPDARLMAVRWLIAGTCDTLDYAVAAIDYAVRNGADVINASWGGAENSAFLEQAIARANRAGVLVVAAAGNLGRSTPFYPAASTSPNVLSVAAIGPDGRLAPFSNRGSWVDLAAPGDLIVAVCISPDAGECPGSWTFVSGTSFAAPHAAGVAAMILQLRPDLLANASGLRGKLINSGVKSTKLAAGLTGSGRRLNAGYAVDITPPSAPAVTVGARAGATIGTASAPMRIAWPASTDASGIDSYTVRLRRAGTSSWTTLTSATTSRSADTTLAYNVSYEVQVFARDRGGTSRSSILTTTPRLYEETSPKAAWAGRWTASARSSYLGGHARSTQVAGRASTWTISGRSVGWVAATGPTRGTAKVYVDGSLVATVNLHAATTSYRRLVWARSWSSVGPHTVRIVVAGTSGHPRVDIDGIVVTR